MKKKVELGTLTSMSRTTEATNQHLSKELAQKEKQNNDLSNQNIIYDKEIQSLSLLFDDKPKQIEEDKKILLYLTSQHKTHEIDIEKQQEENSQLILQKKEIGNRILLSDVSTGIVSAVLISLFVSSFFTKKK